MTTRTYMTQILFLMCNAVIFGTGTMLTLIFTDTVTYIVIGIVASAVAGVVGGGLLAWKLAPRMRQRYWDRRGENVKAVWE